MKRNLLEFGLGFLEFPVRIVYPKAKFLGVGLIRPLSAEVNIIDSLVVLVPFAYFLLDVFLHELEILEKVAG